MNNLIKTSEDAIKNIAALARIADGFDTSTPIDNKTRKVLDAAQMLSGSKAYQLLTKSLREIRQ